ncbi:major facilitator superfamily domain-containing protein [Lipomyces oligophaga]|uniref:major facilitator superfamily domain-containing protein n=1 Tax=Lipomyces oligophaga TaxID=45792 RepID=UPI0034CFA66F
MSTSSDLSSSDSHPTANGDGYGFQKRILLRYSKEEEINLRSKIDRYLMPLITVLFILAFLDRSNIGNARIAGLQESLDITSNQFDWLLTAFYISYISFEWVGFLWNVIPAHIYVTMCLFMWGMVASLQSIVFSYWSLIILRFLLGIGEASFGPGVPTYLSFFYQRKELGFRTGIFMSAAPLSTAFAGTIAFLITSVADKTPIDSWRVLLFVEGVPCMLMAFVVWNYLPDRPSTAYFLNLKEKILVRSRYRRRSEFEGEQVSHSGSHGLKWDEALEVLQDPKVYVTAAMFFLANIAYASMPVFLPLILRDMGYESITAQGLSAPPYIVAFFAVLLTTHFSDKMQSRAEFVIFHASISSAGYLCLAISRDTFTRYCAIFFVATGFFCVVTIVIAWTVNNQSSESGKGTGVVLLNTIGQCGPLIGTRLYPDSDAPYYERGMMICSISMLIVAILAIFLRRHLALANRASFEAENYHLVPDEEDEDAEAASIPSAAADEDETYEDEQDAEEDEESSRYELISPAEARALREIHGFDIDIVDDELIVDSILKKGALLAAKKKEQKFKYML